MTIVNISRIRFSLASGIGLQLSTLGLMISGIKHIPVLQAVGVPILFSGFVPVSMLMYYINRSWQPKDQSMIILVSFYYLLIGLLAGYIGARFGRSVLNKIIIALASVFSVFIIFLVVLGVIFKLTQYES